jgi:signal transduction histidine kinase
VEDDARPQGRELPVAADREEPGGRTAGGLSYPDIPRLELDQLLTQLVDRAQEVIAAQGRLRGLLQANHLITGHLALPSVLRGIVEAARDLIGARYAALGIIAPTGGLAEFVHSGMPEDAVTLIGHLPEGKGLLGALIEDPNPIRLRRIADDARSSGFPDHHPPMESFLGVPIRIGSEVYGNLYLSESTRGEFSAEDEALAGALAATAAAAIENARLYQAARARGEWMQASAAIMRQLLSPESGAADPLVTIAERSREIADADIVTVVRPPGSDERSGLRVEVAVGRRASLVLGLEVPEDGSLAGRVFATGEPLGLSQPGESGLRAVSVGDLEIGPVMALPLRGSAGVLGVLTVARNQGRQGFGAEDLEMASGFANQAAIAIELAAARADLQRAEMLEDRERIAADLHDHVIQRLFASGLTLQGVMTGMAPGRARDRVMGTVEDLDTTIRQIRTSIFHLQQAPSAARAGVRARLLDVATEAGASLGFDPAVRFSGVIDTLPDGLADDAAAVLREALSNVARHARATSVEVDVTRDDHQLTLAVRDNGTGMADTPRRSGLANLAQRAERHGGTCTAGTADPKGTLLTWRIPVG